MTVNTDRYRTYVTQTGFGLEALAKQQSKHVDFAVLVVGDGELPDSENPANQTDLINQVHHYPITIEKDSTNSGIWIARAEIPAEDGDFYIREAGVKVVNENGDLYSYARQPGDYKPVLEEGSAKSYTIRLKFIPGNTSVIEAKIDPSVQFVTPIDLSNAIKEQDEQNKQDYERKDNAAIDDDIDDESVELKHLKLPQLWRAIATQRLVDKLWLGLAAKIFPVGAAIPWFTDVAPEGFAIMKSQAFDTAVYPELAKVFTDGIIPDMRGCGVIGKENNEVIGVFEEGQVKEHGHPNSTVSSTDLGSKNTNVAGNHRHSYGINANHFNPSTQRPVTGNHGPQTGHTDYAGAHAHSVFIGSHAHSVMIAMFGALKNTINHRKVNWIVRMA
ncbi:phage tail-collar fiber domain-containing protein [Vibrio hepatarius]|uniref:phage tail-collar fiber domain-containing protein n=1 Tax=Vibrio hepatarius TaxID=171383 RepID=UPI001C0A5EB4|nr:phage tail protein [Vibrio hepatarius]MBU2897683.1 phage tail protein [Vibrio hepatarius]